MKRLLLGLIFVVVVIISLGFWSIAYFGIVQGSGPELAADLIIPETVCVDGPFSVFIHATNPHDEIIDFSSVGIPAPFLENFEILSVWPDAEELFVYQSWLQPLHNPEQHVPARRKVDSFANFQEPQLFLV